MRNMFCSLVASLVTIVAATQVGAAQAQTYCDELRTALTNGSNERYLASGEFTKAEYRSVIAAQRAAERQACASTAEARKMEIAEQALSRGVPIETYQEVYAVCGPWSSRKCTEDTVRSMFAGAQPQTNSDGEQAADLAASFLTGLIGGLGAGAVRVPHSAPAIGVARRPIVAPRAPMVAHTSPTYVPRTIAGQTAVRPVAVPGATTTSGVAASNQRQGCSGLHASMMNSAAYYQTNPGAQAADLARYNSLCGQ